MHQVERSDLCPIWPSVQEHPGHQGLTRLVVPRHEVCHRRAQVTSHRQVRLVEETHPRRPARGSPESVRPLSIPSTKCYLYCHPLPFYATRDVKCDTPLGLEP